VSEAFGLHRDMGCTRAEFMGWLPGATRQAPCQIDGDMVTVSALALGAEIFASDRVYALAQGLGTFTSSMRATATPKGLDHSFDPRPVLG
jgi:hypothetical protein